MTLPASSLIALRDVTFAPEGKPVLSDITLLADAPRIGIVGRNGSGKTSLARVMAGLVAPTSGTVRIEGADVAKDRKAALGRVGILFQNPDHQIIFPTVQEEIGFGLGQMGLPLAEVQARVADILDQFSKLHWASAAIHQLSQGQRQLVCLMSVIAMAPKIIILDEPFAGLDIPTTRQLERVLRDLPLTLVLITHDPALLAGYDHVYWLDAGQVIKEGPPQSVLAAFTSRMAQIGESDDLSHLAG